MGPSTLWTPIFLQILMIYATANHGLITKDIISNESGRNTSQIAAEYGHPTEEYTVTTEDGYILGLHRLPGRKSPPILLMHGLIDTSETWMLRRNLSLAITLANLGHDVWLGDVRGNMYSRGHVSLSPELDAKEYWNFTFYHHGYYDLPAIIDFVLDTTGAEHLNAIGHSQGTAIFFVLGSLRPEYNSKVNTLIALAPVAFLSHIPPPLADIIAISPIIYALGQKLHLYEIGGLAITGEVVRTLCLQPVIGYPVCKYGIVFPIAGSDPEEYEAKFHYDVFKTYPASTSIHNIYHLGQLSRRGKFSQFDYGPEGNKDMYGSETPPDFDLSKVTMKVALLYANNDKLSTPKDVALLRPKLPNVISYKQIPRITMNHYDFVWGKTMDEYLYPYIFELIDKHF